MKTILVIGGGASGVYYALVRKNAHPEDHVVIIERNDRLLKKIHVTGNGKCNFANSGSLSAAYSSEKALVFLREYGEKEIREHLASIGVPSKNVGDLVYPYSGSAKTVVNALLRETEKAGVEVRLSEKFSDYERRPDGKYLVRTDRDDYVSDLVIFAFGGASSPNLGTDGALFPVLKKHGYPVTDLVPSLCPLQVEENVRRLDGLRIDGKVSLFQGDRLIHEEDGEVLFKEKGLSGIVIFNLSAYLGRLRNRAGITVHVNACPDLPEVPEESRYADYFHPVLADYLSYHHMNPADMTFRFAGFYPFTNSQVTLGGIPLDCLSDSLESRNEKGVYFIGESTEISGICGGFNLMWAFSSAHRAALSSD